MSDTTTSSPRVRPRVWIGLAVVAFVIRGSSERLPSALTAGDVQGSPAEVTP